MLGRGNGRIGAKDLSVRPDDVADAVGGPGIGGVACSVGQTDLAGGVAEEREGIVELLRKRGVLRDSVERDTQDFGVELAELVIEVAEPATFFGSTRRIRLRIEPENHVLALVV